MHAFSLLPNAEPQKILRSPRTQPESPPIQYAAGLLTVFFSLLLLPLFYLGTVAVVFWILFMHVTENFDWIVSSSSTVFLKALYGFVALQLGLILFFLLRPFIPRSQSFKKEIELLPSQEPHLFQFVQQICTALGAPTPLKIFVSMDINAGARFAGRISDVWKGRLELVLGLPLIGGLDLGQFAGVLAHELGHFRQGLGMRLVHVIRAHNHKFLQDSESENPNYRAGPRLSKSLGWKGLRLWTQPLLLFKLNVLIHVFMVKQFQKAYARLGQTLTGILLQQMEFEADKTAIRLVGGETFASMVLEAKVLEASWVLANRSLSLALREGRLADDLPALVTAHTRVFIPEIRKKMERNLLSEKAPWYDTHPSLADRVRGARISLVRGMFHAKGKAQNLFHDFDALSKKATCDFYRQDFGDEFNPSRLVSTQSLISDQSEIQIGEAALSGYFLGLLSNLRPLWVDANDFCPAATFDQLKLEIIKARKIVSQEFFKAKVLHEKYSSIDQKILEVSQGEALLRASFMIEPADFQLTQNSISSALLTFSTLQGEQRLIGQELQLFETAMKARLTAMASLSILPEVRMLLSETEKEQQVFTSALPCLLALKNIYTTIMLIRQKVHAFVILLENFEGNERSTDLQMELRKMTVTLQHHLHQVRERTKDISYPFHDADFPVSLSDYLVKKLPSEKDYLENCEVAEETLGLYFALYFRILGQWAMLAGRVEGALELGPLEIDQSW